MHKKITFCLTSCNRFDLLKRTLDTFLILNNYPIERFIITEDSGNQSMKENILKAYGDRAELIFNDTNLGIYKSIDNMYNLVNTEYIFHCEDDWQFVGNANFMKESVDILDERPDIHRVCVRRDLNKDWVETNVQLTSTRVPFSLLKAQHCGDWCGFSNNPGLRRKEDYVKMFPNGFAEFILPNQKSVFTEHNCNLHAAKLGYRAALLPNGACYHIGDGRSTIL